MEGGWQRLAVNEEDGLLRIEFSRPVARNALDFRSWDELEAVMTDAQSRDDIKVVTLTGRGAAFCAGVDFGAIAESTGIERDSYPSFIRRWARIADSFERCPQPTIAAINGACVGAGFEIALACDIRVASSKAVFAMPQMMMGMVPDVGGTSRLARAAGAAVAKDLILSSRVIDAEEALRWGIVSRVVEADRLAAEVAAISRHIAGIPWPAPHLAMTAIDTGLRLASRRAADREAIADQVLLREKAVWDRTEGFVRARGLKSEARE